MYSDIAILDDNLEDIYRIQDMIFAIQGNWHIDQYMEGRKLLEAIENGKKYDLLLCDIDLKGENGVEIAKQLRNLIPQAPVVFVTNSQEYAVEAYSMEALHYIIKPVRQEDITEVFRRMNHRPEPRHILAIRVDYTLNVLFQDEIIRVESHGHNTVITCINDTTYSIWKPFREIDEMLDDTFVRVKQGVTLNMRWIARMTYRDCTTVLYLFRNRIEKAMTQNGGTNDAGTEDFQRYFQGEEHGARVEPGGAERLHSRHDAVGLARAAGAGGAAGGDAGLERLRHGRGA